MEDLMRVKREIEKEISMIEDEIMYVNCAEYLSFEERNYVNNVAPNQIGGLKLALKIIDETLGEVDTSKSI